MAYFMFIDESGQDHRNSPYEVLAGIIIHDTKLWDLIRAIKNAEIHNFGMAYAGNGRELKAKNLLNSKTFRLAKQSPPLPLSQRTRLVREILTDGTAVSRERLTALGQAKIAFVHHVLDLAAHFNVRVIASIVKPDAPRPPDGNFLRKDYAYLFQRFYNYIAQEVAHERGIVVFDEVEKSQSHILLGQMSAYFLFTRSGQERSQRVVPEPFFVHSDLTTGILLADLAAYIVSHNVRLGRMSNPKRASLDEFGERVKSLRPPPTQQDDGYTVWPFSYIEDLRTREQRGLEGLPRDWYR